MAVRTWVGRFCVADGRVEEEGPWLGSLVRQRPDEESDELYILIEPASPGSEEYSSQLVDVISQLYSRDPLSLTGALTRSLRAAHDHLRDWNRRSLREHQVGAGAGCLALRGGDAYLAQVGPTIAWLRNADGAFRRVEPPGADFEHALGIAEEFEPQLTRVQLNPGDLVLLASTQLTTMLPDAQVERIMARGADDALPELYLLCRDRPNMALVLLSCFEAEPERPPEYLTRAGAEPAPATVPLDDAPASAEGVLVGTPSSGGPATAEASLAAAAGSIVLPPRPIEEQVREITETTAPPRGTGVRLRGESAAPRYRRTTGLGGLPQFHVPKLAVFAVIALVALGLIAYWQLPGSVQQSRENKFAQLVASARESDARAQATSDPAMKRQLLGQASASLADAAAIHKDNADVLSIQSDVATATAALNAVFQIKDWTTVADLQQEVTGSLSVTSAVVGGTNAYFLDAKGKRVIRLPLSGGQAPDVVFQDGQTAGFVTVSRPMEIAWSEQTKSLLMIDDKRQAFAYFPDSNGALPMTVRGVGSLGSIDAIAASAGNLYVLDKKSNQVWRYLPGESGFDSERTGLLDGATLSDATELAVGQDVYVLDTKLGIRRFVGKTEAPFPLAGIDTPLLSPASLSVLSGSNRLIVADRGNKRIVVASADGQFLRQIVSPAFTDLRSVAVDEGSNTIYVLNGDTLMKAPFPP